jgi:hypothetical protein
LALFAPSFSKRLHEKVYGTGRKTGGNIKKEKAYFYFLTNPLLTVALFKKDPVIKIIFLFSGFASCCA